jgi:hypothetical protein
MSLDRSIMTDRTLFQVLWQFLPAILIVAGGLLAASGGFWQAVRQANFNSGLRQKNDKIIELQQQSAGAITGGDSFAEMAIRVPDVTTGALALPIFAHHGRFPLYDVTARIVDLGEYQRLTAAKNFVAATTVLQGTEVSVGNLTPGFARGSMVTLQHPSGRDFSYNVFFVARNGSWTQQSRMKWVGNGWSVANRISGLSEGRELYRNVAANYPLGPSGEVEWGDGPAGGKIPQQ